MILMWCFILLEHPITRIGEKEERNVVFLVGYIQDTTDQYGDDARGLHYQTLEPIPMKNIPCCGIIALSEPATDEFFNDDNDNVTYLKSEEKILKSFLNDKDIVKLSLKRLHYLMNVSVNDLFCSNILSILYNEVRSVHPAKSMECKSCRILLKRYQFLCSKDADYDGKSLSKGERTTKEINVLFALYYELNKYIL